MGGFRLVYELGIYNWGGWENGEIFGFDENYGLLKIPVDVEIGWFAFIEL